MLHNLTVIGIEPMTGNFQTQLESNQQSDAPDGARVIHYTTGSTYLPESSN